MPGKGYLELFEAFELLSNEEKSKLNITFAGEFNSMDSQLFFLNKINKYKNLKFLGVVDGIEKINLFNNADIFCLPTYYAFEGQPISIIEAYASGCAVITTNHSGIKDIFTPGVNGLEVEICNSNSLAEAIRYFINNPQMIKKYQMNNFTEATLKYTEIIHFNKLISIIEK